MELFKLFGTIAINIEDAYKKLDEISKKGESVESKLSKSFEKAGTAMTNIGTKLLPISGAIGGIGFASVKAAADVKAANSQFEQTFGELQETATASLNKVADESGILKTRLQGIGTSIYAFAKASGAESAEAMQLMETSLQATADAAAYYDRSLEETSESLMSFLKGNFENDAALGVSCTETTRNAKAMELFGKKYNDLSEIQKQQTLLKMVTDAQKLSGAMGQASREQDGLENVTGNLTESIKQLGAEIGEVILPTATKLIQKATNFIKKISDMDEGTKRMIVSIGGILTIAAPLLIVLGKAATGIGSIISLYGKASSITTLLTTQTGTLGVSISALVAPVLAVVAVIGVMVAAFVTLWNTNEEFRNNVTAIWQGIKNEFEIFTSGIVERINSLGFEFQNITEIIKAIWQAFCNFLAPVFEVAFQVISVVLSGAFDFILGLVDFFVAMFKGDWQGMWDAVVSILSSGIELLRNLFTIMQEFIASIMNSIWSKVSGIWENIKLTVSQKVSNVVSIVKQKFQDILDGIKEKLELAKEAVSDAIEKIKGFFDFEWHLPELKLPHIKITGEWDLKEGKFPSFEVEWYAKGGVLTRPTIFGMNGNRAMIGGEAGAEAVAPIDVLQGYVAQAVASQNAGLVESLMKILDALLGMREGMKEDFIEALESMRFELNNREFARLVKAVN